MPYSGLSMDWRLHLSHSALAMSPLLWHMPRLLDHHAPLRCRRLWRPLLWRTSGALATRPASWTALLQLTMTPMMARMTTGSVITQTRLSATRFKERLLRLPVAPAPPQVCRPLLFLCPSSCPLHLRACTARVLKSISVGVPRGSSRNDTRIHMPLICVSQWRLLDIL